MRLARSGSTLGRKRHESVMSSGLPNRGSLPSPEGQLRMPPRVIASTCCSLRVRAGACSSRPGRVLAHLWVSVSGRFHDAFVTLPFYNSIREDEARHLESGTQSGRLGLCVRKGPPKTFARSAERRSSAKSRELLGKGGTLSGGQVSGDLSCRGSRGVPLA